MTVHQGTVQYKGNIWQYTKELYSTKGTNDSTPRNCSVQREQMTIYQGTVQYKGNKWQYSKELYSAKGRNEYIKELYSTKRTNDSTPRNKYLRLDSSLAGYLAQTLETWGKPHQLSTVGTFMEEGTIVVKIHYPPPPPLPLTGHRRKIASRNCIRGHWEAIRK